MRNNQLSHSLRLPLSERGEARVFPSGSRSTMLRGTTRGERMQLVVAVHHLVHSQLAEHPYPCAQHVHQNRVWTQQRRRRFELRLPHVSGGNGVPSSSAWRSLSGNNNLWNSSVCCPCHDKCTRGPNNDFHISLLDILSSFCTQCQTLQADIMAVCLAGPIIVPRQPRPIPL